MKKGASLSVVVLLLSVMACGDEGASEQGADANDNVDVGGGLPDAVDETPAVDDLESFSLQFPAIPTAAFEENTQCVIMRLGNPEPIKVGRIDNVLGDTSHHFIVYATNETEEQREPFDCFPFVDTLDPDKGAPLMITQRAEETLQLPEGVGYSFGANQMIRLELHYINLTQGPRDVSASTEIYAMAAEDFEHEADFLFVGSIDIQIRPGESLTLPTVHFPLPENLAGSEFWAVTGHTHQWGTDVSIAVSEGPNDPGTELYDIADWDWDEPETVTFDPTFIVPEGGGFNFSCSWENQSNRTVGFGESANDEMCFFWAYYYPSRGSFVCFHTDQLGGIDTCCPGGPYCDLIEDFF